MSQTGAPANHAHNAIICKICIMPLWVKYMRRISKAMVAQKSKERVLIHQLLERCQGLCEDCGRTGDWRGLSKHEKIFRSRGGDPLDPSNCLMLCGTCHNLKHGIHEV